jgi:PTH1 family peptidyl-tRNA hydrolase
MHYIVGLGNPGEKYANTRHNMGWVILDHLRSLVDFPALKEDKKFSGRTTEGRIAGEMVTVLYPDTFMNSSGAAVRKLVPHDAIKHLVVLYDDIDLPLGEVRVSYGRGSGGHNGLTSIIEKLGSKDFVRVRIGIGKTGFWPWEKGVAKRPAGGSALERYVLGNFTKKELDVIDKVSVQILEVVATIVSKGHVAAMNLFN